MCLLGCGGVSVVARSSADRHLWGGQNGGQPGGHFGGAAYFFRCPPNFGEYIWRTSPLSGWLRGRGGWRTCANYIPSRAVAAASGVCQHPRQPPRLYWRPQPPMTAGEGALRTGRTPQRRRSCRSASRTCGRLLKNSSGAAEAPVDCCAVGEGAAVCVAPPGAAWGRTSCPPDTNASGSP